MLPVAVVATTPVNSKTPEYVTTGVNEYSFDSVVPGEYVLSVAARGEYFTHEYKITVVDSDIVLDASIYQLGDTNYDGVINYGQNSDMYKAILWAYTEGITMGYMLMNSHYVPETYAYSKIMKENQKRMRETIIQKRMMVVVLIVGLVISLLPFSNQRAEAQDFSENLFTISGEISGFQTDQDSILPEAVISIAEKGSHTPGFITKGIDQFSFDKVPEGDYILTIAARGDYVTHEYPLNVKDDDIRMDVYIGRMGDLDSDGAIAESDIGIIEDYVKGSELIEDEQVTSYEYLLADVNRDGYVNETDILLFEQYISGEIEAFPQRTIEISETCKKEIDQKLSINEDAILNEADFIVSLDQEFPLEYFLTNNEIDNIEIFVGENDWGINPLIEVKFADGLSMEEQASFLAENDHVKYMHPHYFSEFIVDESETIETETEIIEEDEIDDPEQYALQTFYEDLGIYDAWELVNANLTRKAKVAVFDYGLYYNHPDLQNVIDPLKTFDALNYISDYVWSINSPHCDEFELEQYVPSNNVISDHGTVVTSVIVAEANNSEGFAGVASGGNNNIVDVYFYNVSNNNVRPDNDALYRAIISAIKDDVDVINFSICFENTRYNYDEDDITLRSLLQAAYNQGIAIVAGAGKMGSLGTSEYHINDSGNNYFAYPSDYEQCISVCGVVLSEEIETGASNLNVHDSKYRRTTISSYNDDKDVSAPGKNVLAVSVSSGPSYGYASFDGTSLSAPYVTSIVAMMCAVNPQLTNEEIYSIVTMTANDICYNGNMVSNNQSGEEAAVIGFDPFTGYGLVNAKKCVEETISLKTVNHVMMLYPQNVSIPTNSTCQMTAQECPDNMYNRTIVWSSSNDSIASVNQTGVVTANQYGKVTITAMSLITNTVVDSAEVQTRYYDVNDPSKYYYRPVYWAADEDITRGYGNVYFAPAQTCTRREFLIFLWRYMGRPVASGTIPFSDVNYGEGTDSYKAILWGYTNGIVNGYDNNTFGPNNPVNRKDAMIMLYRLADQPEVSGTNPFADVNFGTTTTAYKSILWAYNNGITKGYTQNGVRTFRPYEECSRANTVTFLYRYNDIN